MWHLWHNHCCILVHNALALCCQNGVQNLSFSVASIVAVTPTVTVTVTVTVTGTVDCLV